jgi:hypothetical protein
MLARMILMPVALAALAGCVAVSPMPATQPAAPTGAAGVLDTPAAPTQTRLPTPAPPPTVAAQPTQAPTAAPSVRQAAAPQPSPQAPLGAGYLVYQRSDGSLWRSDGAGARPISLAGPTEPEALLPWAAAPDGKTIAIVIGVGIWDYSYRYGNAPALALWLVGADGSNPRKIQDLLPPRGVDMTPGGDDVSDLIPALTSYQELAWSPDGQQLAFVSAHENQVDLYTAALDGTIARLTNTPRLEQGPRWSPDGALVAYRTTSGFGTGAGWGDIALEVTPRSGGQPAAVMDERKLAAGTEAQGIEDMFWIGPNMIVAGLWDTIVGKAEVRVLTIGTGNPDEGKGASPVIFDAPYSALAWNDSTRQLAIAGTSGSVQQAHTDGRKLAPGLFTWSPGVGQPTQIERGVVEVLAWTPQGDALAYGVDGKQPSLRVWEIGAEGDVKQLANTSTHQLRWSLDGQRLATDAAFYSRGGKQLLDLATRTVMLAGWGPQGVFYYTLTDGNNHDLWLWDGGQPLRIDTQLTQTQHAGVVLEQP